MPSPTMLFSASVTLLLLKCTSAVYATGVDSGGWQDGASNGISSFGSNHLTSESQAQDFSSSRAARSEPWGSQISLGHGWQSQGWQQHGWQPHVHHHTHAIPIAEHVEISKPLVIPVYKNIGIPVLKPVGIPVPQIHAVSVPQPYPVHVPIAHPVAIPVIKTIATIVEKKVPYPVEKLIPVPVEKLVPIEIEKHVPVHVEKPYPIHVPIYKHVFHKKSHGWDW